MSKVKSAYVEGRSLPNEKWESFAQAMALGKGKKESALIAGYKSSCAPQRATELSRKDIICKRIDFLQARSTNIAVKSVALSKTWVLRELQSNVSAAKLEGDYSSINRAIELIGKELGMFVERKMIGIQDLRSANADTLYGILQEIDAILTPAVEVPTLPPGEEVKSEL